MLREIRLYGYLGTKYGRSHRLAVRTPAEAVRALCANFPAFENDLRGSDPKKMQYAVFCDKRSLSKDELVQPSGKSVIRIAPVLMGAKSGQGIFQIIMGVVLVIVGIVLRNPGLVVAGVMNIVGGAIQLLTPVPSADETKSPDAKPSYYFSNHVNTTAQGYPVPVGYGRMVVGSAVISAGLRVEELPV